jgi:hypothetical protein
MNLPSEYMTRRWDPRKMRVAWFPVNHGVTIFHEKPKVWTGRGDEVASWSRTDETGQDTGEGGRGLRVPGAIT